MGKYVNILYDRLSGRIQEKHLKNSWYLFVKYYFMTIRRIQFGIIKMNIREIGCKMWGFRESGWGV
jgi:hypothetical protein